MSALMTAALIGTLSVGAGPLGPFFPEWPADLQHDVVKEAKAFAGEFAFIVKDVESGATYTYNGSTPMYLASGIKIPVLIALFQLIREKKATLSEEMTYTRNDVRDGSPLLSYLRPGTPMSLRVLAEAMIQRSDNAATDMVIKRVGIKRVNEALGREGLTPFGPITTLIDVRRLVYRRVNPRSASLTPVDIFTLGMTRGLDARMALFSDYVRSTTSYSKVDYAAAFRAYYRQGYNSAPLTSMVELLDALAQGKVISAAHSAEMVDIMAGTQTGLDRLRSGLPPDIRFAHKTGTQFRRMCDFGIVFMPDGRPVVMVVATKGGRGRSHSEALMARLARRAYWHLATPVERERLRKLARMQFGGPFDEDEADPEDLRSLSERRRKRR
ncbi:MAG: serine hydrolase [Myxococcota bacterium]